MLGCAIGEIELGGVPLKQKTSLSELNALAMFGVIVENGRYFHLQGLPPLPKAETFSFYSVDGTHPAGGFMNSATVVGVSNPKRVAGNSGIALLTSDLAEEVLSMLGMPEGNGRAVYGETRGTDLRISDSPPLWVKRTFRSRHPDWDYVSVSLQYRATPQAQAPQQSRQA